MKCFNLKFIRLIIICLLPCPLFTLQAFTQWSTNAAENNAIYLDASEQSAPRIASDGSGGAIITWRGLLL